MLLITCPHCGPRAQIEFTYGGNATVKRPADPAAVSDQAWHDYVMLRDNPKGWHRELWHHSSGCRTWFKVLRNTHTHKIVGSATLDGELPAPPEAETDR